MLQKKIAANVFENGKMTHKKINCQLLASVFGFGLTEFCSVFLFIYFLNPTQIKRVCLSLKELPGGHEKASGTCSPAEP